MALSIFDDPPTGIDNEPTTAKRYASKKLKQRPIGDQQQQDDGSQLSSMMPGKPTSPLKQQDQDKQYAIKRRLRRSGITN